MVTRGRIAMLAGLLLVLGGVAQAVQKPGGTSRGKGRVSKPAKPGRATSGRDTSRGGVRAGGLGRGIPNGVVGWPTSGSGARQPAGPARRWGKSTGKGWGRTLNATSLFHRISSQSQSQRQRQSGSGLGAGIPKGGLGSGVSNGVPGWPTSGARSYYSHPIDHDRLFLKHGRGHRRGFLAAAHYSLSSFAPEVEPGRQVIYVEPRWVTTDRGKIRFMGGWASAAEGVESLEPMWIPASWYKTGDGGQIRVSGHFVFAER